MFPIIYKKLHKNRIKRLMTRDFDVFNVSDIKFRLRHRLRHKLFDLMKFDFDTF